jgi:hypothetical protein
MRMIWDSAADAKVWLSSIFNDGRLKLVYQLFAAVIVTSKPTFDYNALAAIMGPGKNILISSILYLFFFGLKLAALECTAKAISHRISKIREIAKNFDTTLAATQTPVKRVRKLKDKLATSNDVEDDDDDEEKSPTKKRKTAPPRKMGKPKETLKISKPGPEDKEEDEGGESS